MNYTVSAQAINPKPSDSKEIEHILSSQALATPESRNNLDDALELARAMLCVFEEKSEADVDGEAKNSIRVRVCVVQDR